MPKKKVKYNLKSKITSALRRIWFYSPQRREAMKKAKESGFTCTQCGEKDSKIQIDHIIPVVPINGFDNWQGYITRLFDGELTALCPICHSAKTKIAAATRKKLKKFLNENS